MQVAKSTLLLLFLILKVASIKASEEAELTSTRFGPSHEQFLLEVMPQILELANSSAVKGSVSPKDVCWKASYGRGVGKPIHDCPDPSFPDKSGLLCYPRCKEGFKGVGPVCWETCPATFTDTGAFCGRSGRIISADNKKCPWYDKCGLTFARGCSSCPEGYHNDGCTCRIDPKVFAKKSYGRGVGRPLGCSKQQDYDAGLCYKKCDPGYTGVGPICWGLCPPTLPSNAAAICCTNTTVCNDKVVDMFRGVSTAIEAIAESQKDPEKKTDALIKVIEAILEFVFPKCSGYFMPKFRLSWPA